MPGQRFADGCPGAGMPDSNRAVLAARDDLGAVGCDGHRRHLRGVPGQRLANGRFGRAVPDPYGAVGAAGDDPGAGDDDRPDAADVSGRDLAFGVPRAQSPDLDGLIPSRREDALAIRGYRPNSAGMAGNDLKGAVTFPNPQDAIVATRADSAVRQRCHGIDGPGVPGERIHELAGRSVPDLDGAVPASRYDPISAEIIG